MVIVWGTASCLLAKLFPRPQDAIERNGMWPDVNADHDLGADRGCQARGQPLVEAMDVLGQHISNGLPVMAPWRSLAKTDAGAKKEIWPMLSMTTRFRILISRSPPTNADWARLGACSLSYHFHYPQSR